MVRITYNGIRKYALSAARSYDQQPASNPAEVGSLDILAAATNFPGFEEAGGRQAYLPLDQANQLATRVQEKIDIMDNTVGIAAVVRQCGGLYR